MPKKNLHSNISLLKNLTEQLNVRDQSVFKSERQLRSFFENSSAGMCIANIKTGYFIKVNATLIDWLGYSEEEILSKPMVEFIMPDTQPKTSRLIKNMREGKVEDEIVGFVNQYRHKNGHGVWLKWHASVVNEEGINYSVCVNITKEIQQENEIIETKELYRRITEESYDVICLHNPDGTYKYVSPSMRDKTGWDPKSLIGKNPYELFHPDDKEKVLKQSHEKVFESEIGEVTIRYRFRCRNGKYIWFETKSTPFVNKEGEVIEIKTSSIDVSAQIELEKSLHTSQEIYRQIVKNSNELLMLYKIVDGKPKLVYVSPSCMSYTGYSPQEHIKMGVDEMIHPDDAEETLKKMTNVLQTQKRTVVQYRGRHKTEGYAWAESVLTPILYDGQVNYILLSSRMIQDYHDEIEKYQHEHNIYNDITKSIHQVIIIRERDMNIVWVSPNAEALYGWREDEIRAEFGDSNSFVHPKDKLMLEEKYIDTFKSGVGFVAHARVLNKNIGYRWSRIKAKVVLTPKHSVDKVITFTEDVHDEFLRIKSLEKELEIKKYLSHVAQAGAYEVVIQKDNREYTYVSDTFYEVYDLDKSISKKELRKKIRECLDEKTLKEANSQLSDMQDGLIDELSMTYWITTFAGNRKLIKANGKARRIGNQMTALLGTVQDITEAYMAFVNVINDQ